MMQVNTALLNGVECLIRHTTGNHLVMEMVVTHVAGSTMRVRDHHNLLYAQFIDGDNEATHGRIESRNLKPSKIGDRVSATAEVTKVDGKKIEFKVSASSGDILVGEGTHLRFIVDRERFLSKLG